MSLKPSYLQPLFALLGSVATTTAAHCVWGERIGTSLVQWLLPVVAPWRLWSPIGIAPIGAWVMLAVFVLGALATLRTRTPDAVHRAHLATVLVAIASGLWTWYFGRPSLGSWFDLRPTRLLLVVDLTATLSLLTLLLMASVRRAAPEGPGPSRTDGAA